MTLTGLWLLLRSQHPQEAPFFLHARIVNNFAYDVKRHFYVAKMAYGGRMILGFGEVRKKRPKPLHERLLALLQAKYAAKEFDQTSLATAIGNSQTNAGLYLRGEKAGPLDLDEADAALRHVGSSLRAFLDGVDPRPLTDAERLGQLIEERPGLRRVVELLLSVPKTRLSAVAELIRTVVLPATARSGAESDEFLNEPKKARRTTKAARKRR